MIVEIAGASAPVCECGLHERERDHARADQPVEVPVGQHVHDAVVEPIDRRLGQRGDQPEEDAGGRAEQRRPDARAAAATARQDEHEGDAAGDRCPDDPCPVARVVLAALRVGHDREEDEPDDDRDGAQHLPATDPLPRQARADRQREHDAEDEERLDDDDRPDAERSGLAGIPGGVDGNAEEPDRSAEQPDETASAQALVAAHLLHRTLLLEHGAEREEHGADQRENDREEVHEPRSSGLPSVTTCGTRNRPITGMSRKPSAPA